MHIGLIGGIGPAATDYYYRSLIARYAAQNNTLELTMVHADTAALLKNLTNNDARAQVEIYQRLTDRLATCGADCVVVTSVAGHFCIDAFKPSSPLPIVDLLTTVSDEVRSRGFERLGILGARTVMASHFYGGLPTAQIITPVDLQCVHDAYVGMAAAGKVTDAERRVFDLACQRFVEEAEVDAILLGGTDLALVYDEISTQFPFVDCAALHVDAVYRYANS